MSSGRSQLLVSVLISFLALYAFIWFFQNIEKVSEDIAVDISAEARRNVLLAAERFLMKAGYQSKAITETHVKNALPASDDTLIIKNVAAYLDADRTTALLNWIEDGGHLIVSADNEGVDNPGSEGYGFFEWLGVSRHVRRLDDLKELSDIVSFTYDPDGPEISTRFDSNRTLRLNGSESVFSVRANGFPDAKNYHLIQLRQGNGLVTITSDNRFLYNANLGKHDHAYLLALLARYNSGKIWLLNNHKLRISLPVFLWNKAPTLLISLGIAIILWLWHTTQTMGPTRALEPAGQRNILEHLDAKANYLWRFGGHNALALSNQKQLLDRWLQKFPHLYALSPNRQIRWISLRANLSEAQVDLALFETASRNQDLITQTRLVRTLDQALQRSKETTRLGEPDPWKSSKSKKPR